MYKKLLGVIFFTFSTFSMNSAHAGAFAEPLVGYSTGKLDIDVTDTTGPTMLNDDFKISGLNYGLRAGYEARAFQFGAEFLQNSLKIKKGDQLILTIRI